MKTALRRTFTALMIFLGFLVFFATRWTLNTFGDVSMEEIVFNLKVPMAGVNNEYIIDFIKVVLVPTLICCAIAGTCILVYTILINKFLKKTKIFKVAKVMPLISSFLVIVLGISYGFKKLEITEYLHNEFDTSTFIEDNYVNPQTVNITFPEKKRNLIYIVMESMEYTYGLTENGGAYDVDMISGLNTLANENVNFSSNEKVGGLIPTFGSTWTAAALVSQTSGVPLKLPVATNSMTQYSAFLPGVTSVGDILKENGYNNYFMLGSDATYGARSNYFTEHGDYEIWDYYTAIEEGKIPADYKEWWGFRDSKLYEYAKEKLIEASTKDEPFNLTMLTADTHFEDGYFYQNPTKDVGDDKYTNVIAFASEQVYDFVNWIKEQDFYENTTIVIVGDHTTMDVDFCDSVPETYQRGIYNTFINLPFEATNIKNRDTISVDMFPTTLASLGVTIEGNKLGLGTNLFSEEKTLLEEYNGDVEALNNQLKKKSPFYNNELLYPDKE